MDGVSDSIISSSSLKFELRIMEAKYIELKRSSNLFVRCYLSAGNNSKVELNSQEISSKRDKLAWDECFSLECVGDNNLIKTLKQSELVFELRERDTTRSLFKKLKSSKLVGRVEVAWETIFKSTDMKIEQWFPLVLKKKSESAKLADEPPMIRIGMGIQVPVMADSRTTPVGRTTKPRKWNECGCSDGSCYCIDDDYLLVLDAAMFLATCDL